MCYTTPRPTPSEVGELRFVHPLCAWVVPCVDPLPRVFTSESFLMVHLSPMRGTRFRCVSIFNVESTCETHVPICELLYNVRMWWVRRPGSLTVESSHLWMESYPCGCHSSMASCHLLVPRVVCKRCARTASSPTATTTSTSASSSSPTSPISTVIPCSGIVTGICLASERGNVQLLDWGNMEVCCCWGWWRGCVVE